MPRGCPGVDNMNTDVFSLVKLFAAGLGWRGLRPISFTIREGEDRFTPIGTVVTCFTTPDIKFFIQINQAAPGTFGRYRASVVAHRYDICFTDFYECAFESTEQAEGEAARLFSRLGRVNFKDPSWRRDYLERQPRKRWKKRKRRGWKGRLRV